MYRDASALIPFFMNAPKAAEAASAIVGSMAVVSDFAAAEVSAAMVRRVRMQELTAANAVSRISHFDGWCRRSARIASTTAADIAIAQRCQLPLLTVDRKMARVARALQLDVRGV